MEMNFVVNKIIWARQHSNDIYWPAKIVQISENNNSSWADPFPMNQLTSEYNYFIQYLATNESCWTKDILDYNQYRTLLVDDSFLQYGLHPNLKVNFLSAIREADHQICPTASVLNHSERFSMMPLPIFQVEPCSTYSEPVETKMSHDFLSTPTLTLENNSEDSIQTNQQNPFVTSESTNFVLTTDQSTDLTETTNNNWLVQEGLLIEAITPPLPTFSNASNGLDSLKDEQQHDHTLIIVTTRSYSAPAFISYLIHSMVHFYYRYVVYLDDPLGFHSQSYSNNNNVVYLFCCDQFNPLLQQNLRNFILDRRQSHVNYYFLILNAPCHELIENLSESVIDKRSILILQYHSSNENESNLLCSGDRQTFETFHSTILKHLCNKIQHVNGSPSNDDKQLSFAFSFSSVIQSANSIHHFVDQQIRQTIHKCFDSNFLRQNAETIGELFPSTMTNKSFDENVPFETIQSANAMTYERNVLSSQRINDIVASGFGSANQSLPIWEYFQQNH